MIHVAPCSCELHVEIRRLQTWNQEQATRIRELEAELIVQKSAVIVGVGEMIALTGRAEKAEKELAELSLNRRDGLPHAQGCTGRHWCEVPTQQGFSIIEGQEREAD